MPSPAAIDHPAPDSSVDPRPLIAHVIFRLDTGGLENGVVNLVNRMPVDRYRHAIVCLTDHTGFRSRIEREDVQLHAMHKSEGHDLGASRRLYRLFRTLRPALVHTRNLGTLEAQPPAWLARVPARVHGEHGWDLADPEGRRRQYQLLRRAHAPLLHRWVPLSRELEAYLIDRVGIAAKRVTRIYNGVDSERFRPGDGAARDQFLPVGFAATDSLLVGTVGRMHGVKDQLNLVRAFLQLRRQYPEMADRLRLVMVGDGPLRLQAERLLAEAGAAGQAWLPGARSDIPRLLRALDLFVLPSQREGISNTILEAMASGLPVVATAVGGNPELVIDGETGRLVPASDPGALATSIGELLAARATRAVMGRAGRLRAERQFSLEAMVQRYLDLYDSVLEERGITVRPAG